MPSPPAPESPFAPDTGAPWGDLLQEAISVAATDLRHIMEALPIPVILVDLEGRIAFGNPAGTALLGHPLRRLLGQTLPFTPDDSQVQLEGKGELNLNWTRTLWSGNPAWLVTFEPEARAHPSQEFSSDSDQILLIQQQKGELQDLQEQILEQSQRLRQAEARAREAETTAHAQWEEFSERYQELEQRLKSTQSQLEQARQQLAHGDHVGPPTHLEVQNQQAQRRLQEQAQSIQTLEAELERMRMRSGARADEEWEELSRQVANSRELARRAEQRVAILEQRLYDQEQKTRESDYRNETLMTRLDEQEQRAEEVRQGLEQKIEHISAEEQQAKRLAFEDQLTNLPNLNILQQYLEFTHGLVGRNEGAAVLLLIDIDRLRSVNTTLNVAAGDELLRQFAARLKTLCRNTDVLGRRGEDEFLVVVAHKSSDPRELALARTTVAQMSQSLAAKIMASCQEPFMLDGSPIQITCSIGLTHFGEESPEHTVEQAQAALDRARELGRNRFHVFGPDLHDRVRRREFLVPRLAEALERQEFVLLYQPIIDLAQGKMVGVEALLRWDDPKQGLLTPGDFLAAAESSGLIVPIGEWTIQEACGMAAQYKDLFVSINLSARQLMHGDFARKFMKSIERARVKPEKIVVEISEATSSADPERVSMVLAELARWKVGLAIDDFGTGSSSLMRLQREKPRFIKIDHAFVHQIEDRTSFHIVAAACQLARSLGMHSLAEGVEKESQLVALRRMGCQFAQGRQLSPPVPGPQLKELTRKTWKLN